MLEVIQTIDKDANRDFAFNITLFINLLFRSNNNMLPMH